MHSHTLQVLEFEQIQQMLARRASSALGREAALHCLPMTDPAAITERLAEVSELRRLLEGREGFPIAGIKDIRSALAKCQTLGAILSLEELLQIGSTVHVCRLLEGFGQSLSETFTRLRSWLGHLHTYRDLEERINRCIDPSGVIRDRASAKLAALRREQQTVREQIRTQLQRLLRSDKGRRMAQESVVTLRDGRYVVPIRSEYRSQFQGIVHDQSASGATLFMEPLVVVDPNNRLRGLELEEKYEIERILQELTEAVQQKSGFIAADLEVLQHLDLLYGAAILSQDLNALPPALNETGSLRLCQARHPLLVAAYQIHPTGPGKQVVPLDLEVGLPDSSLLITGPNTGGKTVALKTVGLLVLMAQAGLHIPAAPGTEIPIFQKVFADIGDEQSIAQNLSTFSSHLQQLITVLDQADQYTLVLLDEIGAGTDPAAGAALAMAILEALTRHRVTTIATTHLGVLKKFASRTPGICNGSMAFDLETLQPTYRFRQGLPGGSYALEIANRLGLPQQVVERATDLLGGEEHRLEELINELEETRQTYEKNLAESRTKERRLTQLIQEYKAKLRAFDKEINTRREQAYQQAEQILAEANALIEHTVADIRKTQAAKESIKTAHRQVQKLRTKIKKTPKPKPKREQVTTVSPGDVVWVDRLNVRGVILEKPDSYQRVKVQVGDFPVTVAMDYLSRADEQEQTKEPDRSWRKVPTWCYRPPLVSSEIDLRGCTSEEAIARVEDYLDQAYLADLQQVSIIHGKGTGVLRREIGKFLHDHPRVKAYHLGEWNQGGDGVTICELI